MRANVATGSWLKGAAGIWLQWTLGSIVGWVLGCLAGILLGSILLAVLAIALCAAGVRAAILSRLVRSRAWWWALIGGLVWPVSIGAGYAGGIIWYFAFAVVLSVLDPPSTAHWFDQGSAGGVGVLESVLLFAPGGAIAGIVYGALQWPSVRQPDVAQRGWLAAHAASGLLSLLVLAALLSALSQNDTPVSLAIAALGGAVYGGITGLPLSKVLASKQAMR